jgi:hypothetical protein
MDTSRQKIEQLKGLHRSLNYMSRKTGYSVTWLWKVSRGIEEGGEKLLAALDLLLQQEQPEAPPPRPAYRPLPSDKQKTTPSSNFAQAVAREEQKTRQFQKQIEKTARNPWK